MVDTLFTPGGTASGYYVVRQGAIHIFDIKDAPVAVVNARGVFGCATKRLDGKVWYNYATPRLIGEFPSYGNELDQVAAARAIALGAKTAKEAA